MGPPDPDLQISLPAQLALNNLHRNGRQTIPNLSSPMLVRKEGVSKQVNYKQYYIPAHWWEPVVWWLQHTQWSLHGITGRQGKFERQAHRATWVELMMLFQCVTGFKFPSTVLDLRSQETVFKFMIQRVLKQSTYFVKGQKNSYGDVWGNGNGITSAKPILGHPAVASAADPLLLTAFGKVLCKRSWRRTSVATLTTHSE